jgi:hypothetical protein
MKALLTRTSLLAASVAILALPQVASAEYYVPPSNSAATQYTEALPTAGGDQDAEKGSTKPHHSPAKVLGSRNAQRLESQGEEGHEVAQVVAETAPTESAVAPPVPSGPKGGGGNSAKPHKQPKADHEKQGQSVQPRPVSFDQTSGSSGLGEVIGQATGASSSGGLGLLLPLVLLGSVAWAVVYVSSKRRRKPAA